MKRHKGFSVARWWSIVRKEFTQLRRDRLTFAMIVGIPILQMALFGYAINTDPSISTRLSSAPTTAISRAVSSPPCRIRRISKLSVNCPTKPPGARPWRGAKFCSWSTSRQDLPGSFCATSGRQLLIEADATDPSNGERDLGLERHHPIRHSEGNNRPAG